MPAKNLRLNCRQSSFWGEEKPGSESGHEGHRGHVLVYNKVVLYIGNHGQGFEQRSVTCNTHLPEIQPNLVELREREAVDVVRALAESSEQVIPQRPGGDK